MERLVVVAAAGVVIAILMIAGLSTSWRQCSTCLAQEYERGFLGITIESWSEREYDEYGTMARHAADCGPHEHQFEVLDTCRVLFGCDESGSLRRPSNLWAPKC